MSHTFWSGHTGRQIRDLGRDAQVLAAYLTCNQHDNLIGLYKLPIAYIVEDIGGSAASIERALVALETLGAPEGVLTGRRRGVDGVLTGGSGSFCFYDAATSFVWIVEMARYQLSIKPGERLSRGEPGKSKPDGRISAVAKVYDTLSDNPFLGPFYDYYGDVLAMERRREGKTRARGVSTGRRRGADGVSTGSRRVLVPDPAPDPDSSTDLLSQSLELEEAAGNAAAANGVKLDPADEGKLLNEFLRWFCDEYARANNGARFKVVGKTDVPIVRGLLRTWTCDELKAMSLAMWADRSDQFLAGSDRGLRVLSVKASYLDRHVKASGLGARNVWTDVLEILARKLSRHDFGTWFGPTKLLEDCGDVVRVEAEEVVGPYVGRHFLAPLTAACEEARTASGRGPFRVEFGVRR